MEKKPLAGYCRISEADLAEIRRKVKDGVITPEEGAEEERRGVLKQHEDVRALGRQHGREVVIYEDNDLSAFKRNVRRPDFERMIKDLRQGKIDGIVAYDIDRVYRQPRDLERVIDIYESSKRPLIFDTQSGMNFDLTTGDGRFSARLFVNIANKASEDTSRRIKRDNLAKAKKGKYHGGQLAYGWREDDRTKLDRKAAGHIEKAIEMHFAGDRMSTIMKWLSAQGVVNPNTNKPFTWAGTKTLIYRARNAGIRVHLDEPLFDDDGNYVMGDWEPIISIETYEALNEMKNVASKKPQEKDAAKYLLTNIVRCGRCGNKMNGKPVWVRGKKTPSFAYNCTKTDPDACGKLGVSGPRVDELIKELVWAQVEKSLKARKVAPKVEPWEGEADLADVEEQIREIKQLWAEKKVKAALYLLTLDELEERKKELLGQRALHNVSPELRLVTPELVKKGWSGLSLERQRKIVRTVLAGVIVHPSPHGRGGGFDSSRIEPAFL
ncbi:recombinase family protein [Actinocorallia libanotica]|uniref:Recombinase family protein n=1 Tax=Actinocorallia libanotica TaxID=46162 RepID=A0ABP4B790_9ACTN